MAVVIRATDVAADHEARVTVLRSAWLEAYGDLLGTALVEALFAGEAGMEGDWTSRRSANLGTLVADDDGAVIGLVSMGVLEPGVAEVAALYVHPARQGEGVGQALWDAALAVFVHRGLPHLELFALAAARARGFYERQGCVEAGSATVTIGDRVLAAVRYVRDTTPPADGAADRPPARP